MKFDLFCLYWMHGRLGLEELARGGDGRIECWWFEEPGGGGGGAHLR